MKNTISVEMELFTLENEIADAIVLNGITICYLRTDITKCWVNANQLNAYASDFRFKIMYVF